mmetsp:Transcript_15594/g.46243  ORF Transcript_15594/g.46243 Transcript_15594/m.46243 type:complete len:210 (+) Transcript_15594:1577-2206(+)
MAGDDRRPIAGLSGGLGLGVFIRSIWFRNNHKLLSVIPFELISTAIAQHRITPIVLLDAGMAPWAQSKLHTLGDIFGGQAVDLCVLHLLHALQQLVVIFPRQCVFELVCLQRSPTPWKRTFHKKLTIRHSYGGVHLHAFFANSGPVPRVANVLAVARDAIPGGVDGVSRTSLPVNKCNHYSKKSQYLWKQYDAKSDAVQRSLQTMHSRK